LEDLLVWIDLEMSGLDPERHVILEIGTVITNSLLQTVAEGPVFAIHHPVEALHTMEAWSREHHTASGLLDRVQSSIHDCQGAKEQTLEFVSRHCGKGRSPLCGNSVWQDRRFLIRYMPELEAFFHYRNIDVSSIKELVKRWYPHLPPFQKKKAHTVMSDIEESIRELIYYRDHVFPPIEDRDLQRT